MSMPKDGTPILAYCVTRRLKGWMVVSYSGNYWYTIPGRYGVDRIVAWAKLPVTPSLNAAPEVDTPLPQKESGNG